MRFDGLAKAYTFGVAASDDAQVRHAFQPGVTLLGSSPRSERDTETRNLIRG